jgi:radical SAM superfamily enzyme YgiQ (UPF0313 family)
MYPMNARNTGRVEIFLIRPTKYDDEGYLIRHVRGVLPSNSLGCLWTLTREALRRTELRGVRGSVHVIDESVEAVPERAIRRLVRRKRTRVIACLVGVQTSQFPRAVDLALRLRAHGAAVLIGGFHVSGSLAMGASMPAELERLAGAGVTLVSGEVEEIWPAVLRDAAGGTLEPRYDTLARLPDLSRAPVPRLPPRALRRFAYQRFATVDGGRGCPYRCSFCTIINVQGRRSRSRDPAGIAAAIRANWAERRIRRYFFTDDDFARNPRASEVLDHLVRLREDEGIPIRFLMQVDLQAHRIPGFVDRARRAGCLQVFLGMESLDPASLEGAGKRQNRVADYAAVVSGWHDAGILTHAGYIVGFPEDTPDGVRAAIDRLKREVRVDVASFFMLTPLPGSADHRRMAASGARLDPDLNRWDTFHPVTDHPRMTREEWYDLYRQSWSRFYEADYLRERIAAAPGDLRVTLLQIYLWYLSSIRVDRFHPMMSGFLRKRPRADRRPGWPVESLSRHARRRVADLASDAGAYAGVLRDVYELWRQSAPERPSRPLLGWLRFAYETFLADRTESAAPARLTSSTATLA